MMKRCSLALAVAALALAPALGHAQDIPAASRPGLLQAGIALSSISPDLTNNRITGITGFVTFDFSERLGVEADIHLGSISTPNDIAVTFAKLLGRPVRMEAVPRESWEHLFKSQGMKNPLPRIRMIDGFNEGWIDFELGEAGSKKGSVVLETVLKALTERDAHSP